MPTGKEDNPVCGEQYEDKGRRGIASFPDPATYVKLVRRYETVRQSSTVKRHEDRIATAKDPNSSTSRRLVLFCASVAMKDKRNIVSEPHAA